jgi:hypothetical protein
MPDLKKLLEPLDDESLPDRWSSISRREVRPLPEPRRSRVPVFAVAAAVVALLVAAVFGLSPLTQEGDQRQPGSTDQPPDWLVQAAYQAAYGSGDLLPDSAAWALLPRNAIPTPVGTAGAGSTGLEYVIVLEGHFTAYWASVPAGASLPTGSVLSIAYDATTHAVTDSSVGDGDPGIEDLMPFTLPTPDQVYASPEGWSVPVPPGWNVSAGPRSTVVATSNVPTPTQGGPYSSLSDFPDDGIAVTVSRDFRPTSAAPAYPPLSFSKDFNVVWGPDGRTAAVWARLVGGAPGVFQMSVELGPDASPIDRSALREMIAAFTFAPVPTSASLEPVGAGLPSSGSVVDGRFVTSVQLDDGLLRVDPLPADQPVPSLPQAKADELWASPAFAGKEAVTIGYGLITMQIHSRGPDTVTSVPGWIAFAYAADVYSCPAMTSAPSPVSLPSAGYAAVTMLHQGHGNFQYTAASFGCSDTIDPSVALASHVESIPWEQRGPITNGVVDIVYGPPGCGRDASYNVGGVGGVYTLEVDMTVPNDPLPCPYMSPVHESVRLTGDGGGTVRTLEHAPTGLVTQVTNATP